MVEVRNVSDDCCCSYRRGCVEVDMWVCYVKWKKSEKGDGVGGVVLGEGGTALEGGGGKKCKCCSYRRGCVEVDMWVCYVKWKKSEKGDGVGGVVLGEGGTALEGGGGKKCK